MKIVSIKKVGICLFLSAFLIACEQKKDNNQTQNSLQEKHQNENKQEEKKSVKSLNEINLVGTNDDLKEGKIDENVEVIIHDFKLNDNNEQIEIIKIKPNNFDIKIEHNESNPKLLTGWSKDYRDSIIINGGYFNEDFSSTGFLAVKNQIIEDNKFDQNKSGLLVIKDNKLSLRDLNQNPIKQNEQFDYAMQSYPILILDGQENIREDSQKLARRTAVGIDYNNNVYLIIYRNSNLSLFKFMKELMKTEIDFKQALNLDGGGSTGISLNYNNSKVIYDSFYAIPNILIFEKKYE